MIYLKQNAAVRSFLSNERKFSLCLFQTVLLILGFALSAPSSVSAEGADESSAAVEEITAFVFESLYAANRGYVYGDYESIHAGLVLLVGGIESGLRVCMIWCVAN